MFVFLRMPRDYNEADDPRALRRKKKSFYAKLKKQEMEREAELAKKYRNRVSIIVTNTLMNNWIQAITNNEAADVPLFSAQLGT